MYGNFIINMGVEEKCETEKERGFFGGRSEKMMVSWGWGMGSQIYMKINVFSYHNIYTIVKNVLSLRGYQIYWSPSPTTMGVIINQTCSMVAIKF